jgi:hypothetical protein
VKMITATYMIILSLYFPCFQLFPGNRESIIYLPARGTSTRGMAGRIFHVYYGRECDIVCIRLLLPGSGSCWRRVTPRRRGM